MKWRARRRDVEAALGSPVRHQPMINEIFRVVAPAYATVTKVLSFGRDRRWKQRMIGLLRLPPSEARVLDVACGTGDLARLTAARAPQARIVALDILPEMLASARRNERARGVAEPDFVCADALRLPFGARTFDAVTVGYGLRNFPSVERGLAEIVRVLKPGGTLVSLDFGRPVSPRYDRLYRGVLGAWGSVLGWAFHGNPNVYRYIELSVRRYPGQRRIERSMQRLGFRETATFDFLGGALAINLRTNLRADSSAS